jgi:type I restriction enzyme R subunit
MPHKSLAFELLKKLLNDEIGARSKKNLIQSRSFAEMLEKAIRKYQNKAIEAAKVIEELIELARKMREADKRGEELSLSEDEIAFYDALEVNDSAVKVLGDDTLKAIARELVQAVRNNVTIDWTLRESIQAKLKVMVKRILRKHGYPPDKEKKATETVLEQATLLCRDWADKPLFVSEILGEVDDSVKYTEYLPVYSLEAAAGKFSESQDTHEEGWMKVNIGRKLNKAMFIAKVAGHSMEPLIPNNSYCVFSADVAGTRQGKIILAQHHDIADIDTRSSYTVKKYKSEKKFEKDGTWRHEEILLEPINPDYEPITLLECSEGEFKIIAEFVSVV